MLENFPFLQNIYFGNTVQAYLVSLFIFFGSVVVLLILQKVLLVKLKKVVEKNEWKIDDVIFSIIHKCIIPLLYVGAFFIAVQPLQLNEGVRKLVNAFCVILLTIQVTKLAVSVAMLVMHQAWLRQTRPNDVGSASKSLGTIIKIIFWGIALVFVLDNLGFNISAVVAGLGIGGLAIAFAAQAILGDLFNYFVIFFDRPFEVGDFIILGDYLGEIEHIGIKTTRIRSLSGEQIVIANSDLTASRIRNYKRMQKRRIVFQIGVVYQTSLEQMKKIPEIIREIIKGTENTVFDRCHFKQFGNFSLDVESVYYVLSSDYAVYMNTQQQINLKIMETFKRENIEFAYPTQTLFVSKETAEKV